MPVAIQNHKKPFQAGDLPPLSPVGLEISRLSSRDEVSASQLARLISKDAALAAKVLRIANSPFYGLRTKVKTLDHAILVLGQVNIASICSAFTVMGALKVPPSPGHDRYNLKILQKHFIVTGIVARWMAQHLDSLQMPVTDSFLGGLFHDIGELAIVSFYPQHLQDLWQYEQAHPEIPLYQAERTLLGFDHQEIGAAVLHHWQLPQVYIDIAQSHHTARSTADSNNGADSNNVPDSTNEMMVLLLQAADQVALAMETSVSQMATPARPPHTHWQEHVATFMAPIPNLPSGMAEQLKIDMEHLLEEANVMLEQGGG